jgi:hypothetical protein
MSYNYLFFRCAPSVRTHHDLSEDTTQVIGSDDQIRSLIATACPDVRWLDARQGHLFPAEARGQIGLSSADGKCFSVSHVTADEVQELCDRTGLVVFDGQAMRLFFPQE